MGNKKHKTTTNKTPILICKLGCFLYTHLRALCRPTQPRNYKWSASTCLRQQWQWLLGPDTGGLSVQQLSFALPTCHRQNEVTSVGWKSNNLARPYPNDLQYCLHCRERREKTLSSCKAVNHDRGVKNGGSAYIWKPAATRPAPYQTPPPKLCSLAGREASQTARRPRLWSVH